MRRPVPSKCRFAGIATNTQMGHRREQIDYLAENPSAGDEIPGARGVRKLRFEASGRGNGAGRDIYFYSGDRMPIHALLAYAKSAKGDLNPAERRTVATIAVSS